MKTPYITPATIILSIQTESPLLTLSNISVNPDTEGNQSDAEVKADLFDFEWE